METLFLKKSPVKEEVELKQFLVHIVKRIVD